MRIDGDPANVNCNCDTQRDVLYVSNFDAMTLFYDLQTQTIDPKIYNVPSKIRVNKVGRKSDPYSQNLAVCRFESDWFNYYYDDANTLPVIVRTKIRVNLYDQFQSFVPYGGNGLLRFNWGIHFTVQYSTDDQGETLPTWVTSLDEEVYKPIVTNDECNPIGQFYTSDVIDSGSTFPTGILDESATIPTIIDLPLKDPWDVYDVPAAEISLV